MSAPIPDWPSEDFGPYRLLKRLGVGGMATVYLAVHRGTGERIALKRLLPQFEADAGLVRQFRREAEIARSLAHPNMACVHEFGHVKGVYYLTMEEVDGPSILNLLRRANEESRPGPVGVSLWILREILCALDYAMTGVGRDEQPLNIVHRDLSPSNVIINSRGEVKIIDFGVAKALHGRYATNSGRVKGKLGYMAPEALAGRAVDSRSDLYSLAVLGWELLTAQRLFRGSEKEQMALRSARYERTPPSVYNQQVPDALNELLAVALSSDPVDRWSSAAAMLHELDPLVAAAGREASTRALRDWIEELGMGSTDDAAAVESVHHRAEPLRSRRACRATSPLAASSSAIPAEASASLRPERSSAVMAASRSQSRGHEARRFRRETQGRNEPGGNEQPLSAARQERIAEERDADGLAKGSSEFAMPAGDVPAAFPAVFPAVFPAALPAALPAVVAPVSPERAVVSEGDVEDIVANYVSSLAGNNIEST